MPPVVARTTELRTLGLKRKSTRRRASRFTNPLAGVESDLPWRRQDGSASPNRLVSFEPISQGALARSRPWAARLQPLRGTEKTMGGSV